MTTDHQSPLSSGLLPSGIRSRVIDDINGLSMHVLEAGFDNPGRPAIVLLHGFPELAYSWRKIMPSLADAGFHVIAPDLRGYGRTTGWDARFDCDLAPYGFLNLVRDVLGLVWALERRSVACVVGHDFGSPLAAWCALLRPDVFQRVALMSAPFGGPPTPPKPRDDAPSAAQTVPNLHEALAALDPPRKHYQWYYSTRDANENMWHCPQGVADFLRAYFHHKSADWAGNSPFALEARSAEQLAKLPTYYLMRQEQGMAETVAAEMPHSAEVHACNWLPDEELAFYAAEYGRTGFQGGLNWYRSRTGGVDTSALEVFADKTIDVPSVFIAGRQDWGVHQTPGAFTRMQESACANMVGVHLLEGAGHWVQQEQPTQVCRLLLDFLS